MTSLSPTLCYCLLELEEVSMMNGRFHIPEVSKLDSKKAMVKAVGPGRYTEFGIFVKTTLKPGEWVFFNEFAGYETSLDGLRMAGYEVDENKIYRMVIEDPCGHTDIWAVIEGGQNGSELRPLANKVIVELLEEDQKTAGGLWLPETSQRHTRGKVLAVGPGKIDEKTGRSIPVDLEAGDVVYLGGDDAFRTTLDGKKLAIYPDDWIGGIQEPAAQSSVA